MKYLRVALLLGLLLPALLPMGSVQASGSPFSPDDWLMPTYFPQTHFWLQGLFRQYWQTHGGLFIFGYPITGEFKDSSGLEVQYFQRAIFEYHPENKAPYNVLLRRLGAMDVASRQGEKPFQPLAPFANSKDHVYYPQTHHSLNYGFKTYWNNNGGLMNFGYPLSEEFDEQNQPPPAGDGKVHTVQYFERTRFEYHPENKGTPYEVLLGLLGSEYLKAHPAPAAAVAQQDPQMPPYDPIRNVQYGPHVGYGFNAFSWYDAASADTMNQKVDDMVKQAGFSWIRMQLQWDQFERAPNAWDPLPIDRIVDRANANGLHIIISVVGPSPAWVGANGNIPTNTSSFQTLMQFLANRYKGKVQAWEIWNEENLASNVGGNVSVAPYVGLLKAGYTGVKAGDPGAMVLFGALTPTGVKDPSIAIDDVQYLKQIYAYNNGEVKQYYDALGAHPGSNNNPPDTLWPDNPGPGPGWQNDPSFYFRRIEQLRQVMIDNGQAAKQIWLTEFGWSTKNAAPGYGYGAQNSDADQAAYLVRAFQMGKLYYPWMGVMAVWNLNYAVVTPPTDEKYPWSVLNSDWSPRPSYTALKNMPK